MSALRHLPTLAAIFFCGTRVATAAEIPAPTEPSNLTVKPLGVNSFELKWKDNSDNEVGWEIYTALKGTKPAHYQWLASPNINRAVVITNDLPGKQLVFQIAAYRGTPQKPILSKLTSVVTVKAMAKATFAAPTKFRAVVVDDGQIRLLWKDNATRETAYQIDYKPATAKAWTQLGLQQPGVSFSVTSTGFLAATNYAFRVRAVSVLGNAPPLFTKYSAVAKAKTKPFQGPSDLVVTPEADAGFSFKWKDNSSLEEGFELQKQVGTADFTALGTVTRNEIPAATVPGFALDTAHQFRIRGFRTVGSTREYSAFSNVVSIKSSTLTAPTNLASTTVTNNAITLTWKAGSSRPGGYSIDYREAGTTSTYTTKKVGNLLTATLTNLTSGKLYEIRLKATASDFLGNVTASSAFTPSIEVRARDSRRSSPADFSGLLILSPSRSVTSRGPHKSNRHRLTRRFGLQFGTTHHHRNSNRRRTEDRNHHCNFHRRPSGFPQSHPTDHPAADCSSREAAVHHRQRRCRRHIHRLANRKIRRPRHHQCRPLHYDFWGGRYHPLSTCDSCDGG
jgi:Fibronectin type III domain